MKTRLTLALLATLALSGCSREISLEEAQAAIAEAKAEAATSVNAEAAQVKVREIRGRPVDQAGRDSAAALVAEVDALYEELILAYRQELARLLDDALPQERRNAAADVEREQRRASADLRVLQRLVRQGTAGTVDEAIRRAGEHANFIRQLLAWLQSDYNAPTTLVPTSGTGRRGRGPASS